MRVGWGIFGLGMAATAAIFGFRYIATRCDYSGYREIGTIALVGHILTGVFLVPLLPYDWDIGDFHRGAIELLGGGLPEISTSVDSFASLQAVIYAVFGTNPSAVVVVNGFFAVLTAIPVLELAKRLYPGRLHVTGVLAIVLLLPLPFFFRSIPMRDSLGVLLFFTFLALIVRSYDTWTLDGVLLGLPVWGMLVLLRPELGVITLIAVGAGIFVALLVGLPEDPPSTGAITAIVAGCVAGLLLATGPVLPVESIENMMLSRDHGGAAYLAGMRYSSWFDLLLYAPARAIYFQFAPFSLQVNSAFDLLAFLMTPILLILTVAGYRSVQERDTNRVVYFALITAYIFGVLGYGLIDSNFGTTTRHRMPFTLLLVIFATPTISEWERSFRKWISERPDSNSRQDEQQGKAEKFHGSIQVSSEDTD